MDEFTYERVDDSVPTRSLIERRSDGEIVLSTENKTREVVRPGDYSAQDWISTEIWIESLTREFGSRKAAEIFVQATGRTLPQAELSESQNPDPEKTDPC